MAYKFPHPPPLQRLLSIPARKMRQNYVDSAYRSGNSSNVSASSKKQVRVKDDFDHIDAMSCVQWLPIRIRCTDDQALT